MTQQVVVGGQDQSGSIGPVAGFGISFSDKDRAALRTQACVLLPHLWSEDSSESHFSPLPCRLWDQTQVVQLGGKGLYVLSHLTGPWY